MPKRIQRRRTKGWTLPEGVVYVGRPTRWGNPFAAWTDDGRDRAIEAFRGLIAKNPHWQDDIRRELRGKDLACWCPLDKPCHADVLLELANAPEEKPPA